MIHPFNFSRNWHISFWQHAKWISTGSLCNDNKLFIRGRCQRNICYRHFLHYKYLLMIDMGQWNRQFVVDDTVHFYFHLFFLYYLTIYCVASHKGPIFYAYIARSVNILPESKDEMGNNDWLKTTVIHYKTKDGLRQNRPICEEKVNTKYLLGQVPTTQITRKPKRRINAK